MMTATPDHESQPGASGDGPRKHCETADGTLTNTRTHPNHEPGSLTQRSESPPIWSEGTVRSPSIVYGGRGWRSNWEISD